MLNTKQVLCIDDDTSVLLLRKLLLESSGFKTYTATNGKDGLRILDSRTIDAVVLDYMMPEMNGSEVCAAIKKTKPQTPVIMLSAHPLIREGISGCGDAFINKGDDPKLLLDTLRGLLAESPAS